MVLTRLFETLLSEGVTLIATSNRPPRDLYLGGINREHFLSFVEILETRVLVRDLQVFFFLLLSSLELSDTKVYEP